MKSSSNWISTIAYAQRKGKRPVVFVRMREARHRQMMWRGLANPALLLLCLPAILNGRIVTQLREKSVNISVILGARQRLWIAECEVRAYDSDVFICFVNF